MDKRISNIKILLDRRYYHQEKYVMNVKKKSNTWIIVKTYLYPKLPPCPANYNALLTSIIVYVMTPPLPFLMSNIEDKNI